MEFISLDIETTGFSYATDDIIEIGAWHFKDGVSIGKFKRLVRPLRRLSTSIQQLTGITDSMVSTAETLDSVLPEFFDFCGNLPIVGYNLPFDYGFLCFKGRVLGLDFTLEGKRQGIDVLRVVKKNCNLDSYKLPDVCKALGIVDNENVFHRADFDALVTKLVLDRYINVVRFHDLCDKDLGTPCNDDVLPLT